MLKHLISVPEKKQITVVKMFKTFRSYSVYFRSFSVFIATHK